ncbi:MAG: DNA polymerase [Hadesarchaea archaeon]|nr:DNA polymerase [Hadesarchaea archaeon]
MRGFLIDSDYVKGGEFPHARLFVKRGKEVITCIDPNFRPYFYVIADRPSRVAKAISKLEVEKGGKTVRARSVEVVKRALLGKEIQAIKVTFDHPNDVAPLRHEIGDFHEVQGIYEFDIPLERRYLIDHGLVPMSGIEIRGEPQDGKIIVREAPAHVEVPEPELNVMSFDIEVYNPTGNPRPEKDPIIMISLADNRGLRKVLTWKDFGLNLDYVEVVKDEREMLCRFIQLVEKRDVDVLLGYNTDLFDFPYIRERAGKLGVKLKLGRDGSEISVKKRRFATVTRIPGRVHIDLYAAVNFLATIGAIKLINYTLENVYKHVTGKKKPDVEFSDFCEAWEGGGEKAKRLLEYSMSDADATLELGLEFLPLLFELSRTVKQSLFDISRMTSGQLVEWLLIYEAHKRGELVPPRPVGGEYLERRKDTYVGAYVMEPVRGLHENLVVFDFRSLYPSIIVTHNIDPSTLNCSCCKPEEATEVPGLPHRFCAKKRGFIPAILERLITDRAKLKGEMKKLDEGSREYRSIYNRQWALKIIANSFYGMLGYPRARWYSKKCAESVTSFGRRYIKDTIEMARREGFEVVYSDTDSLYCKLNGKTREDALRFLDRVNEAMPGVIELELEDFYKRGIFVSKKRYAVIDDRNKILVKGLEFVRRDWATIAKKTQEAVLEAILRDGSPEKAARIVRSVTKSIIEGKVDLEDLVIYTQLKKSIGDYLSIGPHVAVAKRLREMGRVVEPGMLVAYVVVKGSGSVSDRAVPVEELRGKDYDAGYYIGHQVLPAVMRIMEVLGYGEDDLRYGRAKQTKLGKFI